MTKNRDRAAAALRHALELSDFEGWRAAAAIWAARLDRTERAGLAWAALRSLPAAEAEAAARAALGAAGAPLPAFLGGLAEARCWASCAADSELKAYSVAAAEALRETDRAALIAHLRPRAA